MKRIPAFKASAWAYYNFAVKNGLTNKPIDQFKKDIKLAESQLTELDNQINSSFETTTRIACGSVQCVELKIDKKINPSNEIEFKAMRKFLYDEYGIVVEMDPELHELSGSGIGFFEQLSPDRLKGMLNTANIADDITVNNMTKHQMAKILDASFRENQKEVRDVHYSRYKSAIKTAQSVKENPEEPGVNELDR